MFHLRIVTPTKKIFDGESDYLSLATDDGIQVILPGHAPYMATVTSSELSYSDNGKIQPYAVTSGYLEVSDNDVKVILDNALHPQEIDIASEQEAIKRAEELVAHSPLEVDISKLQATIKLANLHITTARKYREKNKLPQNEDIPS
jgi:F-type H+-transporting ATPase subunit epsilon